MVPGCEHKTRSTCSTHCNSLGKLEVRLFSLSLLWLEKADKIPPQTHTPCYLSNSIFNQIHNIYNFNESIRKSKHTLTCHLTFKRQTQTPHHSRIMLCCSSASWLHGKLLPENLRSAPIRGNRDSQGKDGCCQYCRDCWKPQRSSGHERGSYTDTHEEKEKRAINQWAAGDFPCMNQPYEVHSWPLKSLMFQGLWLRRDTGVISDSVPYLLLAFG